MQKPHSQNQHPPHRPVKPWLLPLSILGLISGALLTASFLNTTNSSLLSCSSALFSRASSYNPTRLQMDALLHYATSRVVPQQSVGEIRVSFDVIQSLGACNFLVFGLGHDSMMWASFNARGKTLFLEEDPKWVQTVLKDAPALRADTVKYRTQLSQADELLKHFDSEPDCSPQKSFIRGNDKCRLALNMLSDEVYDTEWDMIMLDAPRGYFAEAPGRMAAIYSAAVMARNRKKSGVTHVFLHDIDRRVEKLYAEKFLCKKYLTKHVSRLWHFEIPPVSNASKHFC